MALMAMFWQREQSVENQKAISTGLILTFNISSILPNTLTASQLLYFEFGFGSQSGKNTLRK
jgi:hypothetical protein